MLSTRFRRKLRPTTLASQPARLDLLREYHEELFALGVTPAQARILLYLLQHPTSYRRQCAKAFGVTAPTVGLTVHALQKKRWVTKQRSPQDDRYVFLMLTRKGRNLARKIQARLSDRVNPFMVKAS